MDQRMIAKIQRFDYKNTCILSYSIDLSCWQNVINQPYSVVILPFPPVQLDNFPVFLSKKCTVSSDLLLGCLFKNSLSQ